ncbi:MAG: sigma-54-dependent Fis family transcriptional regulator [Rhodothermales bacterium]|nr:sigma-54-dependent Fis family transcriptional regulator [Rhodothermales bacterium]
MSEAPESPRTSFQALTEIALVINSIQEPAALLEKVLEIAMDTLLAERGFVLLEDASDRRGFTVKAQQNVSTRQIDDLIDVSTSVVHRVLQSGEPIVMAEAQEDERFAGAESIVLHHIQSIACVPLRIKNRQIGAVYLDSIKKRGRFTPGSIPFLTAFANQAAIAIEHARLHQSLRNENSQLRQEIAQINGFDSIIGQSPRMQEVFRLISRVLDTDASVLIEGESGTGKELVARAIHYNGARKGKPFVALFCGSLPDSLLESELFGHKKGSFTGATGDKIGLFEAASGGTVLLDEVGDLSTRMQTSLLRVLQEGEIKRVGENEVRKVDVRVISATNKPLRDLIKSKEFREDLFYRLNTISITTPALRHRRSDIPLLAHFFLERFAVNQRSYITGFTPEALQALQAFPWPGNVRELENTIRRAVVMAPQALISVEDLQLPEAESLDASEPGITLKESERRLVTRTLKEYDDNISETARVLGVSRSWLHYKLKEWEAPS